MSDKTVPVSTVGDFVEGLADVPEGVTVPVVLDGKPYLVRKFFTQVAPEESR